MNEKLKTGQRKRGFSLIFAKRRKLSPTKEPLSFFSFNLTDKLEIFLVFGLIYFYIHIVKFISSTFYPKIIMSKVCIIAINKINLRLKAQF